MATFQFSSGLVVTKNSSGIYELDPPGSWFGTSGTTTNGSSGALFSPGETLVISGLFTVKYLGADDDMILTEVVNFGAFGETYQPGMLMVFSQNPLNANQIAALSFQAVAFDTLTGQAVVAPCFTRGTLIRAMSGMVPIEDLRAGDLVDTIDNGLQPIRWIGSSTVSGAALKATPKLRPIHISAGALGEGLPSQDLRVSPQHRILVRSKIAVRMFGAAEILVPAVKLVALPGIYSVDECDSVEYFHMLFDRHEIVLSNGAESESMHTGPMALRSLSSQARAEIFSIFPELEEIGAARELARPVPSGKDLAAMFDRHVKNTQPIQRPLV
ncbi:Hint domain-containing protein [Ketogulonicigenium vulgare]|uniref:Hint domain-containing protein n=1 Tax=Ketogulonicigenium vulgare TaxID=92945 RepID=UPI0023597AC7|nr:Hint domain-containing protein [Ketogulonicigenium vulgare]